MRKQKMTLDDYINKYGPDKGLDRYNKMLVRVAKRTENHKTHPYPRLTKEWFCWRYPDDGLLRYEEHVSKSRQSEEAMIKRHGEIEGRKIWQETLRKKNMIVAMTEKYGIDAEAKIKQMNEKRARSLANLPEYKKLELSNIRQSNLRTYLDLYVVGKTRLTSLILRHGVDEGERIYHNAMKAAYAGPNRMSAPALRIYEKLKILLPEQVIHELYCDADGKKEFWLNNGAGKLVSYDFTDRTSNCILEYNGSFWHPIAPSSDIHPVTKKTLREMYEHDIAKLQLAKNHGFEVFVITDTMSNEEQDLILDNFCTQIIIKRK